MFTGIIEEIGKISSAWKSDKILNIKIFAPKISKELKIGQSVSVNGACLSVINMTDIDFETQAGIETLNKTTLQNLNPKSLVHLERAMILGSRLDGHIVQGHVDGICSLIQRESIGENIELTIKYPKGFDANLIEKGSVALDGVSLTIHTKDKAASSFKVTLIPQTISSTLFSSYNTGKIMNIELDLIGKYVHNVIQQILGNEDIKKSSCSITQEFLIKHGFN
jgi:riboflavin synthase